MHDTNDRAGGDHGDSQEKAAPSGSLALSAWARPKTVTAATNVMSEGCSEANHFYPSVHRSARYHACPNLGAGLENSAVVPTEIGTHRDEPNNSTAASLHQRLLLHAHVTRRRSRGGSG